MSNFVIVTDSACDISPEILKEWGVTFCSLTFRFDGSEKEYLNYDMPIKEFYQKMREGGVAKTAAVSVGAFEELFEEHLKAGNDVLYIAFSSGLSTTYNSGRLAALSLSEKYPERKIIAVDTLAASAGFGLLLNLALQKKNEGATIEEVAEFVENNKLNLCQWFIVDDLVYLKRGGRVSPTVAFVGNMLGIKPVLHVDDEGHLTNVSKVRGRKMAIQALAAKYDELALNANEGTFYISHSDCLEDAQYLASLVEEKYKVKVGIIADVGPVIGAHSGPGTLAFFFVGKNR